MLLEEETNRDLEKIKRFLLVCVPSVLKTCVENLLLLRVIHSRHPILCFEIIMLWLDSDYGLSTLPLFNLLSLKNVFLNP